MSRACHPRVGTAGRGAWRLAAGLAAALSAAAASALTVEFDIQPAVLELGAAGQATFTVRGTRQVPEPALPAVDGLRFEPAGREQSTSFGPGGVDSAVTFRYSVLATRVGDHRIESFRYRAGKEEVAVPAVAVRVVPAGQGAAAAPSLSDLVFARMEVSRPALFVQESVEVVFSIYARGVNLAGDVGLSGLPDSGLAFQPFQELGAQRETVNGLPYDVRRFRGRARVLTAGRFRLAPTLRVQLLVRSRNAPRGGPFGDDLWQRFFGGDPFSGGTERRPLDLAVEPATLDVKPLPDEGRPADFSGAVGRCELEVVVKPTEVTVGEPVTIRMSVSGTGNPDAGTAPVLEAGEGFRVYEAKLAAKEADEARDLYRKQFEQVVIPREASANRVPAVRLSFFDPAAGAYRTLVRGPFDLVVRAATNGASRVVAAGPDAAEPAALVRGSDLVYLKAAPGRWTVRPGPPAPGRTVARALHLLAPAGLLALYGAARRRERLARDPARARRERAPRAARAALRRAAAARDRGDAAGFFEAAWAALCGYFGNRLNLPPGGVSAAVAAEALRRAGMPAGSVRDVEELFRVCEEQRFAGGAARPAEPAPMAETLDRLAGVLRTCERYLR